MFTLPFFPDIGDDQIASFGVCVGKLKILSVLPTMITSLLSYALLVIVIVDFHHDDVLQCFGWFGDRKGLATNSLLRFLDEIPLYKSMFQFGGGD